MHSSRTTIDSVPQPFHVLGRLLLWVRDRLGAALGSEAHEHRGVLEVCTAVLLALGLAGVASLGIPPVLIVAAGLTLSILFVVAHSFVVACEPDGA